MLAACGQTPPLLHDGYHAHLAIVDLGNLDLFRSAVSKIQTAENRGFRKRRVENIEGCAPFQIRPRLLIDRPLAMLIDRQSDRSVARAVKNPTSAQPPIGMQRDRVAKTDDLPLGVSHDQAIRLYALRQGPKAEVLKAAPLGPFPHNTFERHFIKTRPDEPFVIIAEFASSPARTAISPLKRKWVSPSERIDLRPNRGRWRYVAKPRRAANALGYAARGTLGFSHAR